MTLILDTSQFAGLPDYHALRDLGAEGVIIRSSSGPSHRDALLDAHIAAASRAGVTPIAVYAYCYSWHDGAHQAAFAVQVAASVGLPVCVDFERTMSGPPRPTDEPHLARVTGLAWLRHHRSLTGRAAVVYGPVLYLRDLRLTGDDVGPLWAAHVGVTSPLVPPPWSRAVLHQYEHNASVPGATSGTRAAVDWNRTDLTVDQLARVFRGEPGTRPPARPFIGPAETFVNRDEGPVIG